MTYKFASFVAVFPFFAGSSAFAIINVAGDFSTAGDASVQITQNVTLTVTTAGNFSGLVFDEWVATDDSVNQVDMSDLTFSLNGGAAQFTQSTSLIDNYNNTFSSLTPNDGFFFFDPILVSLGDTVTFSVQTVSNTGAIAGMNPALDGPPFSGQAFLMDSNGNRISNLTPVPEPATAGLLLGGVALGLLYFRRRE